MSEPSHTAVTDALALLEFAAGAIARAKQRLTAAQAIDDVVRNLLREACHNIGSVWDGVAYERPCVLFPRQGEFPKEVPGQTKTRGVPALEPVRMRTEVASVNDLAKLIGWAGAIDGGAEADAQILLNPETGQMTVCGTLRLFGPPKATHDSR